MIRLIIIAPGKYFKLVIHYRKMSKNQTEGFLNWWGKVLPVVNHLPDIFHIQWAKALPYWYFLKELFGVHIVLSLRGTHITYSPIADQNLANQYSILFPKVDKFHAVSKSLEEIALKYGANSKDVDIIYSATNYELIKQYNKSNWEHHETFQFVSVGRFHWVKGYHYALTAIKNLQNNNLSVHYTIIAQDHPTEEILYQIDDLSLQENVTLIRFEAQDDVYRKICSSDCMLLPSVEEGIANVVLEAMVIGLPVISSNCGGMGEIIDHQKNGFLFRNRDVDHLTQIMIDMINLDTTQRRIMAETARARVKKKHNLPRLGDEMKELYKAIEFA
jgi:colanic acid/amylovoran biosynthesis glycosyltransferase